MPRSDRTIDPRRERSSRVPRALTIAGSDSGGGAGIQADLRAFAALGVHGSCVVTAVTAQGTTGLRAKRLVPATLVAAQLDAVLEDLAPDAVKTGMLGGVRQVEVVARTLGARGVRPVVDPIVSSSSGVRLLSSAGVGALVELLLPLARLLTPNHPEAELLLARPIAHDERSRAAAARELLALGPSAVLMKGGHVGPGDPVDLLVDAARVVRLRGRRIDTSCTRGTGCSLSAAITALLARGLPLLTAVRDAHAWLHRAIAAAVPIGEGRSPVHAFHAFYPQAGHGRLKPA